MNGVVKALALATCALVALAPAGASASGAAKKPVRLVEKPTGLVVGQRGRALLAVTGQGTPRLRFSQGASRFSYRTTRARSGQFRALVTFPANGYWAISARLRGRWYPLGRVHVLDSHQLFDTEDLVALPDGSLLVTEGGNRDRVLRVNPATGRFTVVANLGARPHDLALAGNEVLVADWDGLRSFPIAGGPQRLLFAFRVGAIAVGPSGQIYYGLGSELRRLDAGGDVRVATGVAPRAIAVLPGGDLLVTELHRLLRIDPGSGAIDVVVPFFPDSPVGGLLPEPSGATLVTHIGTGRILRVQPNGSMTVAASGGLIGPCALARTPNGTVYVLNSGYTSYRNTNGSIRRLKADGSTTEVRLVPEDRF